MIIIHHGIGVVNGIYQYIEDNGYQQIKSAYEKLNAEEVKELVKDLKQVYPQNKPCLIAGPLDEADPSNLDTLLKIVEEPLPNTPTLILWAYDLGSVPFTIRSRCGEKYWFGVEQDHPLLKKANEFLNFIFFKRDLLEANSIIKSIEKGKERDFIEACCESLIKNDSLFFFLDRYDIYSLFKEHLRNKRISKLSLYALMCSLTDCKLT